MERRLTAIMAADVVGYSRLMAGDEAGTLAQLKAHRKDVWMWNTPKDRSVADEVRLTVLRSLAEMGSGE